MAEEYGRAEWRKDTGAAQAEAMRRVAVAAATGADTLDFSDLVAMTALPSGLSDLPLLRQLFAGVRRPVRGITDFSGHQLADISALDQAHNLTLLNLTRTDVTDLTALSGLTGLTTLNLSHTPVTDLSGLLQIPRFADETALGLRISGTPAADPKTNTPLSGLSNLPPKDCAIAVVRYLKGLTPDQPSPTLAQALAGASPI